MGDASNSGQANIQADVSATELMQRASEQTSRLVREELALARVDMTAKGKHAGIGVGLFTSCRRRWRLSSLVSCCLESLDCSRCPARSR
jgi:Putative Actinobacterial Holin-X, holin superfamily III